MKRKLLVIASLCIASACWAKPPSDLEGRAVILRALDSCPRLALERFTRVNGSANGDQGYTLAVKYSVRVIPPADSASLQQAYMASASAVVADIARAQQAFDAAKEAAELASKKVNAGAYSKDDVRARDALLN